MNEPNQHRCQWAQTNELLMTYHDSEWAVPVHDDRLLFEMLNLEAMQAGLSWLTILGRRDGYRRAFDNFDVHQIIKYDDAKRAELLQDTGIIRHRLKINAIIDNAQACLDTQKKYGSLDAYLWSFTDGQTLTHQEQARAAEISQRLSKDLKKHGFRFLGPTTCYAFMQAVGLINDHAPDCFRAGMIVP
jgi:DNA-3-methyladenine glycosylase I